MVLLLVWWLCETRSCPAVVPGVFSPVVVLDVSVSAVCDQVDQVAPAHRVDDIDEAHQVDPAHRVDHKDELGSRFCIVLDRFCVDIRRLCVVIGRCCVGVGRFCVEICRFCETV